MIRETLDSGSVYFSLFVMGGSNGLSKQWRTCYGCITYGDINASVDGRNTGLRVTKIGNTFQAYFKIFGSDDWVPLGSAETLEFSPWSGMFDVGIAVTSNDNSKTAELSWSSNWPTPSPVTSSPTQSPMTQSPTKNPSQHPSLAPTASPSTSQLPPTTAPVTSSPTSSLGSLDIGPVGIPGSVTSTSSGDLVAVKGSGAGEPDWNHFYCLFLLKCSLIAGCFILWLVQRHVIYK